MPFGESECPLSFRRFEHREGHMATEGIQKVMGMISQLGGGMAVSIQIFAVTLLFSLPLGLFISFGRMSKNKVIRTLFKAYISVMRGTPLMLQLMVVYFGPYYLFGLQFGSGYRIWAAMI